MPFDLAIASKSSKSPDHASQMIEKALNQYKICGSEEVMKDALEVVDRLKTSLICQEKLIKGQHVIALMNKDAGKQDKELLKLCDESTEIYEETLMHIINIIEASSEPLSNAIDHCKSVVKMVGVEDDDYIKKVAQELKICREAS